MRSEASWAGLICHTHILQRQRLPNNEWSKFQQREERIEILWLEGLWEKVGFKTRVENAIRNVDYQSRIMPEDREELVDDDTLQSEKEYEE